MLVTVGSPAAAQNVPSPSERAASDAAVAAAAVEQATVGPPATLTFANRPIVQLRASLLGRPPDERVAAGRATLDRLADAGVTGPIETRQLGLVTSLDVAGHRVVALMPSDVDVLAGETPASAAASAAQRLQVALSEVEELRRPRLILVAIVQVLLVTALLITLLWVLRRAHAAATRRIEVAAERRLRAAQAGNADFVRSLRIVEYLHRLVGTLIWMLGLLFVYAWLTFALTRFPYTRPWGESLHGFFMDRLSGVGASILGNLPGLFTVILIVVITRFMARLVQLLFQSVEDGRVTLPWVYTETAQPTRKLLTVLLWLFAVVMAYPYLPGSHSAAFKGMSVFVGLVLSLGSSGIVNQVMSGFTLTYSRALRAGDFVAVGDVEGTVTQVGMLSTKITTNRGEDVTIPNALVVSQRVTNYSRLVDNEGVFVATEITIGYDVAWRQVEALLLMAAGRSAGVRREPAPRVRPTALEDAYVRYTLLFCVEHPAERRATQATVHAHILDAFNEYEVQITSPRYETDPTSRKIVPRDRWFAAPAVSTSPAVDARDAPDVPAIKTVKVLPISR
jgi:small-conductance mechanosensitive channel